MAQLAKEQATGVMRRPVSQGGPIGYWRLSAIAEQEYNVPDTTMSGHMDAQFFLTKEKNFIPHEYPCRTKFADERRDRHPVLVDKRGPERIWIPFGSPRVDLSGFWFRATAVSAWAETTIETETAGTARLKLSCCGGAVLFVNGEEAGHMSAYQRNFETDRTIDVNLNKGLNQISVFFDDLAERDARYFFELDYIAGPEARISLEVPCESKVADEMEELLNTMHFERPSYSSGMVAFNCPVPVSCDLDVEIVVEGDFLAEEHETFQSVLKSGSARLEVGTVDDFHSDFRHFDVRLKAGGLTLSRPFTVEIAHCEKQGTPPKQLDARIEEALRHIADKGYSDAISALARLALGRGGETAEDMISVSLPKIENCHDCADFHLVPLLFGRIRYGELLTETIRRRIDKATLEFRYWMDEPGNDVQWYFSENHALLFHTAAYLAGHFHSDRIFTRANITGTEQSARGAERLRAWFDHFEQCEMAEFNSVPYFPIDLKGLTTLYALAHDEDIRQRAENAILRLVSIVAASAHHGTLTAAQGRSYEHTLMAARTSELSAIARVLWSKGFYGRTFQTLPQFLLCLRDFGLKIPEQDYDKACLAEGKTQEWMFSQGENRFAHLYHYKTAHTAMGSLARYRWREWGYQETVLQLRIGTNPDAQIWVNHPGEVIHSGFGRPSYWGGCGALPRVHQYRNLAIVIFEVFENQPDFSHIWFPEQVFDETMKGENFVCARSGKGLVEVIGDRQFETITEGPTAGMEVRQNGRKTAWIFRLSQTSGTEGTLNSFHNRFGNLSFNLTDEGVVQVEDPEYGMVTFDEDGTISAEGRTMVPSQWSIQGEINQLS
ncbi:hypothetical protein [Martelella mediterranea]|uniref:Uncharacterized protein n=1 Tax=Martelella mediterranea TaxID=293089 RepID=A0A4V2V342_9HYPH|nr:hypothetical protein [Martelella mediterranea]TCT28926.1 hypothetical protein EDC90_10558 [Martelella mediterranea]